MSKLKVGVFLAINTQDEFNELAGITEAFEVDSIHIDEEYVAYLDYDGSVDGSVNVRKVGDFIEEYPQYKDTKLRKFKVWKRKFL